MSDQDRRLRYSLVVNAAAQVVCVIAVVTSLRAREWTLAAVDALLWFVVAYLPVVLRQRTDLFAAELAKLEAERDMARLFFERVRDGAVTVDANVWTEGERPQ